MCTVTFIPSGDGCYITSNRDEKQVRKPALAPREYTHGYSLLTYPKDADAGGTWIAMKDNGDAAVLLNGAFLKHTSNPPYSKSRGLVFLDIFTAVEPTDNFKEVNLFNIEPFTLILYTAGQLNECRWDGNNKHSKILDEGIPHIWSSVTLYDEEVVDRRRQWFENWLVRHPSPTQQDILDFHRFGGDGDTHNDLRMNRNGKMLTVSITGVEMRNDLARMRYLDLQSNQSYTKEITLTHNLASV